MKTPRSFVWTILTSAIGMVLSLGACNPSTPTSSASQEAGAETSGVATAAIGSAAGAAADRSREATDTGSMADAFAITNPDIASTLPGFVQMPNGSRVISHFPFSNGIRMGGTIMATTRMSRAELIAFHRQAMTRDGLVMEPEVTGAEGETVLTARSPDQKSEYVVRVSPPESGGTLFSVNYVQPQA